MCIKENLILMNESLIELEKTGKYDVLRYTDSLLYQTNQLEYFYCHLVKNGDYDHTYYHVSHRPHVHELAYFNIGRGYPKELMDGHWCYVVKDMKYKVLIIPCTIFKNHQYIHHYEMPIKVNHMNCLYCLQLSDIKCIDIQRIDLRKPFYQVLTPRHEIMGCIKDKLL